MDCLFSFAFFLIFFYDSVPILENLGLSSRWIGGLGSMDLMDWLSIDSFFFMDFSLGS
jgi:hypothetical protein